MGILRKLAQSTEQEPLFVLHGLSFTGTLSGVLDPYCELVAAVETEGFR
jgi:hypothetical protein